jgi:fructokinase
VVRVLAIGEVLWDVIDGVERLGGAPLNVAAHLARLGHEVAIASGVGRDRLGAAALEAIEHLGVSTRFVVQVQDAPTGIASVTLAPDGSPTFEIARPAAFDLVATAKGLVDDVVTWDPDWLVLGTLAQTAPPTRALTGRVAQALPGVGVLYDLNLRPGTTDPDLVRGLLDLATVAKLNETEARVVADRDAAAGDAGLIGEAFATRLATVHGLRAVCITRGAGGLGLWLDGNYVDSAAYPVNIADTIGAGDAVAAALIHGIGAGRTAEHVADLACRIGALVASRDGAIPSWSLDEAWELTRARP